MAATVGYRGRELSVLAPVRLPQRQHSDPAADASPGQRAAAGQQLRRDHWLLQYQQPVQQSQPTVPRLHCQRQ